MTEKTALVLLSGGQDSTTCLAWALDKFDRVQAIGFNYGQRHSIELRSATAVAMAAGVEFEVVDVPGLGGSSLTDHSAEVTAAGGYQDLPSTFTPGRNAVFLALAGGIAAQRGIHDIVTGICQTDYSGYPDCREDFAKAMETAMGLALNCSMNIHAPLMHLTKAETVEMALHLDALHLVALSHTCYHGKRPACGVCPACLLRLKGFDDCGVDDPIEYERIGNVVPMVQRMT